jgi:CubicO group peptidase (beta-lactamase class C family)
MIELTKRLEKEKINSCLIFHEDRLAFDYYKNKKAATKRQKINSCTKSILSALIGIALEQGAFPALDTPIEQFFPRHFARLNDERKRQITIEHLLTMTVGFHWPEFGEWNSFAPMVYSQDWIRYVLERPLVAEPGSTMNYNSGCSHLLTAILQQTTGMSAAAFAGRYLFGPLDIRDTLWHADNKGIQKGADGLSLLPRDMAKIGLLYLNDGIFRGKQIVSADWIRRSTTGRYLTYERVGKYGYHWWSSRIDPENEKSEVFFFALGYGGQYIIVVPALQLVVVFTSELYDDSLLPLGLARRYLFPSFRP